MAILSFFPSEGGSNWPRVDLLLWLQYEIFQVGKFLNKIINQLQLMDIQSIYNQPYKSTFYGYISRWDLNVFSGGDYAGATFETTPLSYATGYRTMYGSCTGGIDTWKFFVVGFFCHMFVLKNVAAKLKSVLLETFLCADYVFNFGLFYRIHSKTP